MKVWEITIPNEHLNYWRFKDQEEKYDMCLTVMLLLN